jgi:hypothetical protein
MTTCPKCKASMDDDQTICRECWNIRGTPSCLSLLIILFFLFGFLSASLTHFSPPGSMLQANMTAVGTRGRDIYVAITGANKDRETELLPPIWPKTYLASTNLTDDIAGKIFKTSTEYFAALYDEEHLGTEAWKPWIQDFEYFKLAGAGVASPADKRKLLAENNLWLIAANVTPEDPDIIPILITRNVDVKEIERLVNCGGATSNLNTRIAIGMGEYKTPFGEKGFVLVRKSGGTYNGVSRHARPKYIFNSQMLPPRDPSKPPIVYLMP